MNAHDCLPYLCLASSMSCEHVCEHVCVRVRASARCEGLSYFKSEGDTEFYKVLGGFKLYFITKCAFS